MACFGVPLKAYLAVLGGFLVHLTLGTLYTWGNINPYVTSYIRKHSSPSTLQYSDSLWVFALMGAGQGASMAIGGLIERKLGSRLAIFIGCGTASLAVMLSYFTIQWSYYSFLVTYGILFGLGIGIAYAPPLAVAMKWFPNHKGVANGVIVAGFGGGACIFDQVQTAYLNPNNLPALNASALNTTQDIGESRYFNQDEILNKVPFLFLILGGIYLCMQIIGVLLLFTPHPVRTGSKSDGSSSPLLQESSDAVHDALDCGNISPAYKLFTLRPTEVIRTRPFITLWFMFFCNQLVVLFVSSLYKTYGEGEVVNDDKFLATVGTLSAVFNSLGRIMWGKIADRFSFKIAIVTLCAGMTVLMGSFYVTHLLADQAGRPLLLIWVCLIFLFFSGSFALFPTAIARTFGPNHVTMNYGLLFTSSAVAGPIGAFLSTLLFSTIHSYGVFIMCSALSLLAMIIALCFNAVQPNGRPV